MNKPIPDSYIAIASSKDMQELLNPLTEFLGIDGFGFHKLYPKGQEICLSNDAKWVKHVHQHNFTIGDALSDTITKLQSFKAVLWSADETIKILRDAREYGWCHGISILVGDNSYLGFTMKNKMDVNVINNYLNHLGYLERFALYFLEKAQDLIIAASQDMRLYHAPLAAPPKTPSILAQDDKSKFIEATPITSYRTHTGYNKELKFTPRELDCLRLFIRGYTTQEVAITLAISTRTAETHLENLKNKTGVANKSELIRFVFSNQFDKFL